MTDEKHIRIDKFLWAVRIFKTRSIASDECIKGRIIIKDVQVKPSRTVSKDDIITVRKPPVTYTYRVIKPIENRVSAKLVPDYIVDLTPEEEKLKLVIQHLGGTGGYREKGTGRPTKKDRRIIDRWNEEQKDS
jgi:ribosome-associated heat shock protein Hsp15